MFGQWFSLKPRYTKRACASQGHKAGIQKYEKWNVWLQTS